MDSSELTLEVFRQLATKFESLKGDEKFAFMDDLRLTNPQLFKQFVDNIGIVSHQYITSTVEMLMSMTADQIQVFLHKKTNEYKAGKIPVGEYYFLEELSRKAMYINQPELGILTLLAERNIN